MSDMDYSCPTKIIFIGEHFVVHGAKAIASAVLPENTLSVRKGKSCMTVFNEVFKQNVEIDFERDFAPLSKFLREHGKDFKSLNVEMSIKINGFKGMGNSASVSCLVSRAILDLLQVSDEKIFLELAMECENIAHGNRASGVDLMSVLAKKPIIFLKKGKERISKEFDTWLPEDTELIITSSGEPRSTTSEMIARFCDYYSGSKLLEAIDNYSEIFNSTLEALRHEDAELLGRCMNAAQELLAPVSTETIEDIRRTAIKNGALGSKLSGAGGEGSIVISLCRKDRSKELVRALEQKGYLSIVSKFTEGGVKTTCTSQEKKS